MKREPCTDDMEVDGTKMDEKDIMEQMEELVNVDDSKRDEKCVMERFDAPVHKDDSKGDEKGVTKHLEAPVHLDGSQPENYPRNASEFFLSLFEDKGEKDVLIGETCETKTSSEISNLKSENANLMMELEALRKERDEAIKRAEELTRGHKRAHCAEFIESSKKKQRKPRGKPRRFRQVWVRKDRLDQVRETITDGKNAPDMKECLKLLDTNCGSMSGERNKGRIAITTDMWTCNNQRKRFMAITTHFVDNEWALQSRIIRFVHVQCPHTSVVLADAMMNCILD
ncbi:hypothetical protein EZV62_004463 [Acer yangbiense]|uniref:Uncharacterized protein n=1 Tax=Acer yangbiense TaxID=1000413 RepID=A0A5C7IK08_9ROSI|nr:hypothetical protein EZV62_004463 [Acer yangbiense]